MIINDELESAKKSIWSILRCYHSIHLKGLRKIMESLRQDRTAGFRADIKTQDLLSIQ
jgi:hypothetical protein